MLPAKRFGGFDVLHHLRYEPLGRVKRDLVAQAFEELNSQRRAVEVALEIYEISLDPRACERRVAAKCWVNANVYGRLEPRCLRARTRRVHAGRRPRVSGVDH